MPSVGRLAGLTILLIVLASCRDRDGELGTPAPETTVTTDGGADTKACSRPDAGYQLRFPQDWYTNDGSVAGPCRFFHPAPFEVPRDTEATNLAIALDMENVPFNRIAPVEDTPAMELLSRRETTVAGNRAVRVETVATGAALLPEGTRGVSYYVDFGSRTLVATTFETADAGTLSTNAEVLDGMMATLTQLDSGEAECSAASLTPDVAPQELPEPVAATRRAIVRAAVDCDYQALAGLALGNGGFTYSFGERGEPAEFWRKAEARGEPLLRTLVEVLRMPVESRTVNEVTQYLWPSAYAYERWEDVPPPDRQALLRLYGEDDLRRFEEFGSYLGYRVGIGGGGDWIFFVAGD